MDTRGVLLILASLLLCLQLSIVHAATFSLDAVVLKDLVQDGSNQLSLLIQTTLTATGASNDISLASFLPPASVSGTPAYSAPTPSTTGCASSNTVCVETWTVTFQLSDPSTGCDFGGVFPFSWTPQEASAAPESPGTPLPITLVERDLCEDDQYILDANIIAMGPFADAAFSVTKVPFYVNDVAYFPYQVTYADLSIAKLTFNTITVSSGSTNIKIFEGSNLGAGEAVELQVHPVTSTVGAGATASAWFSLKLSRQADSPFEHAATSVNTYTVTTTFDIEYKNAKRSAGEKQTTSHQVQSTFVVSNEKMVSQRRNVQDESVQEQLASKGSYLSISVLAIIVAALIGMML